jgi:hypothetical protein
MMSMRADQVLRMAIRDFNSSDGLYKANMKGGTQLLLIVIEGTGFILRVGVK